MNCLLTVNACYVQELSDLQARVKRGSGGAKGRGRKRGLEMADESADTRDAESSQSLTPFKRKSRH